MKIFAVFKKDGSFDYFNHSREDIDLGIVITQEQQEKYLKAMYEQNKTIVLVKGKIKIISK